ncbi:hypothetical protein [Legionella bononiensis]|uniref:Substrate of the Dot/Icm secretion system n=2 Tax=Legionella bononiensis TaxID=2793102 RepID=A0ABS1WCE5_9GAMM|nr:hypothetical protein [Legionella bononiensis]MBL7527033.1 hypothetical protein [Legionella bononiensis]
MLNVVSQGTCAQIYAQADAKEPLYNDLDMVKIWHNKDEPSLSPGTLPKHQYDNDNCVTFESSVPFKTFCEQFADSEFNDPEMYRKMTHNCANGAHFALQLAGIKLDLPLIQFGRFIETSYILRIPGVTLTPLTLFDAARRYKVLQLQSSPITTHFTNLVNQLHTHIDEETNPKLRVHTQTIVEEALRRVDKRPHRLKMCTDLLNTTQNLLTKKSDKSDYKMYLQQSSFFRHRIESLPASYIGRAIDTLAFIEMARWFIFFAMIEPKLGYVLDFIAFILTIKGIYSLVQDIQNHTDAMSKPTPLSTAMVEFIKTISEQSIEFDEHNEHFNVRYSYAQTALLPIESPML